MRKAYTVEAYDKDNDVWEVLYVCENKNEALKIGSFAGGLAKKDMLIRCDSDGHKEPFDWVEVYEEEKRIKVF